MTAVFLQWRLPFLVVKTAFTYIRFERGNWE